VASLRCRTLTPPVLVLLPALVLELVVLVLATLAGAVVSREVCVSCFAVEAREEDEEDDDLASHASLGA
jgi:hypothetical protein